MKEITQAVASLYDRIVNPHLLVRRLTLAVHHVMRETDIPPSPVPTQFELFIDYEAKARQEREEKQCRDKERRLQEARLNIRERFGKNSILRGLNFEEGATARERNQQIGGHKA